MPNRFQSADWNTPNEPAAVVPAIAGLLETVDNAERLLHESPDRPSSSADAFSQVLEDLAANLTTEEPRIPPRLLRQPPVPAPLTAPGDLVVIVGLESDSLAVALSMARSLASSDVAVAGTTSEPDLARVDDRRSAIRAQAMAVRNGSPVLVAFGFGRGETSVAEWSALLSEISPDQVWVAVDAGRKPDDTAAWVSALAAIVPVDAVAVVGSTFTRTPGSVAELNLPIGWVDGSAAEPNRTTPGVG